MKLSSKQLLLLATVLAAVAQPGAALAIQIG